MEYLPYVLDGAVLLIIGYFMWRGAKEGFVFGTFSFLPMLCAFLGVRLFASVVASILKGTIVYEKVVSVIVEKLTIDVTFSERWMEPDLLTYMEMPEFLESFLAKTQLQNIDNAFDLEDATQFFAESVADVCVFIFSGILVFFVILILGKIILGFLDAVVNLPILGFFNKIFGMVLGGVQGVLWIWVLSTILALQEFGGTFTEIFLAMDGTKIANILYTNNILLHMILQVFG